MRDEILKLNERIQTLEGKTPSTTTTGQSTGGATTGQTTGTTTNTTAAPAA